MILARQQADESRRGVRGCIYEIGCEVGGVNYSARSRNGAPYALARALVAAGVEDQPIVVTAGLAGETRYRSIYRMAEKTITESASHAAYVSRYVADSRYPARGSADDE